MTATSETTGNFDRTGRALAILKADVRQYLYDNRHRHRTDGKVLQSVKIPRDLEGNSTAILNVIREAKQRSGYRV